MKKSALQAIYNKEPFSIRRTKSFVVQPEAGISIELSKPNDMYEAMCALATSHSYCFVIQAHSKEEAMDAAINALIARLTESPSNIRPFPITDLANPVYDIEKFRAAKAAAEQEMNSHFGYLRDQLVALQKQKTN